MACDAVLACGAMTDKQRSRSCPCRRTLPIDGARCRPCTGRWKRKSRTSTSKSPSKLGNAAGTAAYNASWSGTSHRAGHRRFPWRSAAVRGREGAGQLGGHPSAGILQRRTPTTWRIDQTRQSVVAISLGRSRRSCGTP